MVTIDFQNIVDTYIDKLFNVYALPEEEQNDALHIAKLQFISELNVLQGRYPLLTHHDLSQLDKKPEKAINAIKEYADNAVSLDCVATCEMHSFKFDDLTICQPRIIDLNDKPNMVISTSEDCSDSDYLYELLLNILLSMPLGQVHISIVNTGLSTKAKKFIQNVSNSAFDVYTNDIEVKFLCWQMTKRLEQRVGKGILEGANNEVIVLLDFDLNQREYAELSKLFERGQEAGINFIVLAGDNDISSSDSKNILKYKNYHILNLGELSAGKVISHYHNLELACLEYINQGLPPKEKSQDIASDMDNGMQNQEFNMMLLQEMSAKVEALQKQNEELKAKENETEWVTVGYSCWIRSNYISDRCEITKEEYLALLNGGISAQKAFIASRECANVSDIERPRFEKW